MSPRRNIPIRSLRWTAVWLVLLQLGVIGLGHPLHNWMHESAHATAHQLNQVSHASHGNCGGCLAEPNWGNESLSESVCCELAVICCDSGADSCKDDSEANFAEAKAGRIGLNTPAPHRCWSWDCAFFRGMHQPLTLAQPVSLVGLDLPSFEFLLPSDLSAEIGEHFSLRARGPPQA